MRLIELHTTDDTRIAARIGHFGFFRAQFEATLWTRVTGLFHRFNTGAVV